MLRTVVGPNRYGNLMPCKVIPGGPIRGRNTGRFCFMDYRRFYENHYGITIPPEYDIHHIDFNRENNKIENLLLLPKDLHRKLHWVRNTSCVNLDGFFDFQGISAQRPMDYERRCINAALDVYDELQIWSCRKNCEDLKLRCPGCAGYYDYSIFRIG